MEIKIFVNNPWQENTVVLYDRTGEAVIIDCGCFSGAEERRLQDFLSWLCWILICISIISSGIIL